MYGDGENSVDVEVLVSADNWRACPQCRADAFKRDEKERRQIQALYGKVPAADYMKAVESFRPSRSALEPSLREDYEQGMDDDGYYLVSYSANCHECGFSWQFEHKEQAVKVELVL